MRQKTPKLILTFHTTTDAIALESACMAEGLPGRLIPVPREIKADCGMAWCAPPEARTLLTGFAASKGIAIAGCYALLL